MSFSSCFRVFSVSSLILLSAGLAASQQATEKNVAIKTVPIKHRVPFSGQEMFLAYCSPCHGTDGKGAGPAAPALKTAPADLTTLAQRNGGRFPTVRISLVLHNGTHVAAHGSSDMPVWGPIFRSVRSDDIAGTTMRVRHLVNYIETLQMK